MTKTHIFLDVDGVLNAVRSGTPSQKDSGWATWQLDRVMGYPIWHSSDMVAALNELAAREDVEFHWLTTWENHAVTELSPVIGINGTEWSVLKRGPSYGSWWKFHTLDEYLEAEKITRFAWVDDDHLYWSSASNGMDMRRHEWLRICPTTSIGLTRDHVAEITAFADGGPGRDLSWLDRDVELPESDPVDFDF